VVEGYVFIGAIYLAFCFALSRLGASFENRAEG